MDHHYLSQVLSLRGLTNSCYINCNHQFEIAKKLERFFRKSEVVCLIRAQDLEGALSHRTYKPNYENPPRDKYIIASVLIGRWKVKQLLVIES